MNQSFKVNNASNLDGITVELNGQQCQVTGTPSSASWSYQNGGTPIVPGPVPGEWTFTVAYKRSGQLMTVKDASGNPLPNPSTGKLWVCRVERVEMDLIDVVNVSTSCYFSPLGGVGGITGTAGVTREFSSRFRVTAPSQTGGNMAGVRVGITQTVSESSSLGSIRYRRITSAPPPLPPDTGTLTKVPVDPNRPLPWWDGDGTVPPYPDASMVRSWSAGQSVQEGGNWVWNGGPVTGDDRPWEGFPDQAVTNTQTGANYLYQWGLLGINRKYRGGTPTDLVFENVLCADSGGCPGVFVPIKEFKWWEVRFEGELDTLFYIWIGGNVSELPPSLMKPVSDPNRGPADNMVGSSFVFP